MRDGRLSHRVALFLERYLRENRIADPEILDLRGYDFPLFHERFAFQQEPAANVVDFAGRIVAADGVIFVSPVYNGSFPGSLKNVIDLLYKEWYHKPLLIVSSTYTPTPGIATVQQLQAIMLKLGALVAPMLATVIRTGTTLAEDGTPDDPEKFIPTLKPAIDELMWVVDRKAAE